MTRNLSARLDTARRDYGPGAAERVEQLLGSLGGRRFDDPESLIQFHDTLLFLRAFPQGGRVEELADELLNGVEEEVVRLREAGADMDVFDDEQVSGIAGTVVREESTYEVARWLARLYPQQVKAAWETDEQYGKLVNALPRLMPLLEDDTFVEPDIPFLKWMANAAGGEGREWLWLMEQFERLPLSLAAKTELYDAIGLSLDFDLSKSPASRTYARRETQALFCHDGPLLKRGQVLLAEELSSVELEVRKLDSVEAGQVLQQAREVLAVRHRELYGTTRADSAHVYQADVGRGVQLFLWGLPPDRRLPLRAYHAGCTFKNGVPINYFESISLFDWAEVGFNTFYTYRDGETAWIYAKVLHLLHQVTGVSCISVYPYQIGFENEEAIQSGAFWFYRKLGFRPGRPELAAIVKREEKKMAKNPSHRTSARTLRKIAGGHIFYEFGNAPRGLYDSFSTRNVGLAVQRRMAEQFGGSLEAMRSSTTAWLAECLHADLRVWKPEERAAFSSFAYALSMLPEIDGWNAAEKQAVVDVIRAKAAPEEIPYLRQLQQHDALKEALVRLGSSR